MGFFQNFRSACSRNRRDAPFSSSNRRDAPFLSSKRRDARYSKQQELGFHQSRRKLDRRIKCGDDVVQEDRTARAVSSGLTRREHGGAFCIDREQPRAFFINSKPRRGLLASQ